MKIGAIIQARTSSTRLPAKVLKHLPYDSNITILQQVIRRTKKSKLIDEIIIATTTEKEDYKIIKIAEKENVRWFKGSKNDVLERYFLAAKENKLDIIVRITSDCPCIDWQVIDEVIKTHINLNADYTSNTLTRTFPHGLDVEVISFTALEIAYKNATDDFEREHVCPYIHTTHKEKFKLANVKAPKELHHPEIRITLDTEEDYALLCAIFDYLYPKNIFFDGKDIVKLFGEKPWLKFINKKIIQKKIFTNINEELKEAVKILDLQDLNNVKKILEKFIK
ncbi:cytidylyltransferase domain-containing protein [Deferribacter abyssi]|uniref:cytidylyltransferase domain-containing protein n=1 Tax=Deferribacter abyssi TaxID=213806 RepID=UPI003C268EAA